MALAEGISGMYGLATEAGERSESDPGQAGERSTEALEEALARVRFVDKQALHSELNLILANMGFDLSEPLPPIEEVRRRMIEGGIDLDDCAASRGIIEMRDE